MKYILPILILTLFTQSCITTPCLPNFTTNLPPTPTFVTNNTILYPTNAPSYITPNNSIVQWYSNHTLLTSSGLIWKHNKTPLQFNYKSDSSLFNSIDTWQNPSYYLSHNLTGDCEDFSLAYASILEAKNIPAEILGVTTIKTNLHWVVKYQYNGHTTFADINRNNVIIYKDINPTLTQLHVTINKTTITPHATI